MLTTLRQRNFALLWVGGLISQTGDWLLQIGLPIYVYLLTGSVLATSITLIASFVPNLLLGSIAGVFVDRWDRRWTMLIANLLLAVGLLPLFLIHDKGTLWLLYPVLFFEAMVNQFVQPAQNALIPQLVEAEQLVTANSLYSVSSSVSRPAGAALGGILLATLGLHITVLLDLISFLCVAAMLWFIRPSSGPVVQVETSASASSFLGAWQRVGSEWLEGMQQLLRRPPLVILFLIWMVTRLGEGVFGTLLVVFVRQVLDAGSVVYGSLLSVQAIGSLLGGLLLAQFGKRLTPIGLLGFGFALFGLIDLLIFNLPLFIHNIWLIGALFILVGIPGVGSFVGFQTLFQQIVEGRLRGRIYSALLAAGSLMILLGMLLAGVLGERLGSVLMLNIQGGSYFLSGVLALLTLNRMLVKKSAALAKKTRTAFFSGRAAPPEHVNSIPGLSENESDHVGLHDDSQLVS